MKSFSILTVVSVLLCALLLQVQTAQAGKETGEGRTFQLVPLEDRNAITPYPCGEYFFGAKTPNGQFILGYAVKYPNGITHNHVLFKKHVSTNIGKDGEDPAVWEMESGIVVLRISKKDYRKAKACLPEPTDDRSTAR